MSNDFGVYVYAVVCKRCNVTLGYPNEEHIAKCPMCGKRWQLIDDDSHIKTTVLEVHDSVLGATSEFLEGTDNKGE